ncbi:MAG: amidohydrolase [Gemmatimonadales bacterium]|nr:amidohydrolase [Gemmatimonadales bacterium]
MPSTLLAVLRGVPQVGGTPGADDPFLRPFTSAIWKQPVDGRVAVDAEGLAGDQVADRRHHGGPDQALLAYSAENYQRWRDEASLEATAPGSFGENLLVDGMDEAWVCVGDTYRVGDVTLQVTKPRQPCNTLARRHARRNMVNETYDNGRYGWYLRVLTPGTVGAGDAVTLLDRPHPEWTVRRTQDVMRHPKRHPEAAKALAHLPALAANWREKLAELGFALLLLAVPAVARAQALTAGLDAAVTRMTPALVDLRHDLHQHPELSNEEVRTAGIVATRLRALGLEVRTGVARTGVVATLRGGRPGPYLALRADMDALPVTEDTPLPWKSTVRARYLGQEVGVAHACGHDLHVAILLGVAEALVAVRERLPGTVQFVFQPAEEGSAPGVSGGAKLMLEEGLWRERKPDAVVGLHVNSDYEVGTVAWTVGPALSAADDFTATVQGRQAHGARPDLSVDPIVTASQVVLAFQTIRSRNMHPLAPGLVTVGIMRGGERSNIIPAAVELIGTVRTYDVATQDLAERRMREILDGTTRAAGGSFTLRYDRSVPAVVNDTTLTRRLVPFLERAVGTGRAREAPPWSVSEDFSWFAREVPGFFFRVGSTKPGTASGGHHTPTFLADDGALPVGVRALATVALGFLEGGAPAARR